MTPSPNQPFAKRRQDRRGIALIVILACLLILSAVLLAFLNSAKTELISSKMYADHNDLHAMMNTSVNMVMAQIRQATIATPTDCWTSQPGLIRTFTNTGTPDVSYKLYSSGVMQTSGALNPATEAATLTGWDAKTAVFTDLNQPVSGVYPILNPAASGTVQGYSVTSAPTTATQSVPMPVQWLYVLADGTLVPPVATGTGTTATIAGAKNSPIVGRIAYWTDDETCKVNINTASEGEYWDVPKFNTTSDHNLSLSQPVQNEFQGSPGHPAGVSLSPIFPSLVSGGGVGATAYDSFYAIAPRVQSGGSKNGTVASFDTVASVTLDSDRLYDSANELIFNPTVTTPAAPAVATRPATAGLTQSDIEKAKFFITAHSRAPETTLFGTPKVSCWPINTDLASTPASLYATAFDRLIALCSTLNGTRYYFQRKDKDSTSYDYDSIPRNKEIYSYLQTLMNTNVPGFGGKLSTKFGADSDQILTEIFDYIRCANLNDKSLSATTYEFAPGTTSRGYGKGEVTPITIGNTRGFGRFVTISEASLWLICTADPTIGSIAATTTPVQAAIPASNDTGNLSLAVDPAQMSKGKLLTETATTKEIRIEAALILDPFTPMHAAIPIRPDIEIVVSDLDKWTIQGDGDAAATNFQFPSENQQTSTGSGLYQLGFEPSSFAPSTFPFGGYMGTAYALTRRYVRDRNGGRLPKDSAFTGSVDGGAGPKNQQYPFISEPVTVKVNKATTKLTFSGGKITVKIRQRTTGTVIQTLTLDFPRTDLPAPRLPTGSMNKWTFQASGCGTLTYTNGATTTPMSATAGRLSASAPVVDTANDIIVSVVPRETNATLGDQTLDPRFVAMTGTELTGALFGKHPNYDSSHSMANTLLPLGGSGFTFNSSTVSGNTGTLANLGAGNQYRFWFQPAPKVPLPAAAAIANGDWDNGTGNQADGGFLNEPDQGTVNSSATPFYADPYYADHLLAAPSFTSPSRTMPSSGMFGSLPTGFKRGQSWQTLLFRRQPGHPDYVAAKGAFTNNPDYLMMDFFWMPVVEPYAISTTLSTDGKINLNYQIVPFNYIERSTGLYAALTHEKVISVPTADYSAVYKASNSAFSSHNYRRSVLIPETLSQFKFRFTNADNTGLYAFRTAAEICDVHLIPDDVGSLSLTDKTAVDTMMATYWSTHTLTGDNSRERPYTTLYPRLTTRSNTFRVHYRVQALKKLPGSVADVWTEGADLVNSEGRGSVLIERYLDANDTSIPDYADNPAKTPTLDSKYKFRVVSVNRFAP